MRVIVTAILVLSGVPAAVHGQSRAPAEAVGAAIAHLPSQQFGEDAAVSFTVRGDSALGGLVARGMTGVQVRGRQAAITCPGSPATCRMAPDVIAHYEVADARVDTTGMGTVQLVSSRITSNQRQPLHSIGWRVVLQPDGDTWRVGSAVILWES